MYVHSVYQFIHILRQLLVGPHTQISRSGHSLTMNISKMAAVTAIVTVEVE